MLEWPRLRFPKVLDQFGGVEVVLHPLEARLQGLDARAGSETSVDIPARPRAVVFVGKVRSRRSTCAFSAKVMRMAGGHAVCS